MKKYKSLLESLPPKTIVFAFGRFQPPTIGHALLVQAVVSIADKNKADHIIFASKTSDSKANPLPVDRKVYYLNRIFPSVEFKACSSEIRTFMEAATALSSKYDNLIMVAGSDRVKEYADRLNKYNGKDYSFKSIQVISAGDRDPDSDTASGMSGSKMRDAAKSNNFPLFRKGLPKTLTDNDAKRLMNEIREGLGIETVKELVKFETDELRESYHAGKIFKDGEIVECDDRLYKIAKRGSNHLLLQNEEGILITKWIQDVSYTDREFILKEDLTEMKYTSADKIKVARLIASALGIDSEKSSNPENLINQALRKVKNKPMRAEYADVLGKMLQTAKEAGIDYDESIISSKLKEAANVNTELEPTPIDPLTGEPVPAPQDKTEVGSSLGARNSHHRRMKVKYQLGEDMEDLSDADLDDIINSLSEDDYLEAYDDEELSIIDEESGELVEEISEETDSTLLEVLSRVERIKSKIRFARTSAKRNRRLKIALKMRSNSKTLNRRARKMAIKAMKERLMKKPVGKMSVAEKERAEKMVKQRKVLINRLAMRMVPKVRRIETDRLTHREYTKDDK